jgi:hypothetical protein
MKATPSRALVERIIKLYGPVIDLRKNPEVIIDILRRFDEPPDGGNPCGGVPSPPPPPPSSSMRDRVTNDDILKAVLKIARDVSAIKAKMGAAPRRGK